MMPTALRPSAYPMYGRDQAVGRGVHPGIDGGRGREVVEVRPEVRPDPPPILLLRFQGPGVPVGDLG